jgi:hypothetical protein
MRGRRGLVNILGMPSGQHKVNNLPDSLDPPNYVHVCHDLHQAQCIDVLSSPHEGLVLQKIHIHHLGSHRRPRYLYYCVIRHFRHNLCSNGSILAPGLPNVQTIQMPESTLSAHTQRDINRSQYRNRHLQPRYTGDVSDKIAIDKAPANGCNAHSRCWVDVSHVK